MSALVLAAAVVSLAGGVETSDFRYQRAVEGAGADHVAIEPDGRMFAHAREGFGDLRVVDASGDEVPWRARSNEAVEFAEPAVVLNSGREDGAAVALLDLGPSRAVRDRIVLDVPDRGFVGRAVVLGSDRREGPFRRLGSTGIYDVGGARRARSTTAVFPPSDFRFLLVRATGVSAIVGATVASESEEPYRVERVPVSTRSTENVGTTVLVLDLGFRDVPVDELRIAAATATYDRDVEVAVANAGTPARWTPVAFGRVSRFEGAVPTPIAVGAAARFLRVTIDNGDDDPLEGVRVRALSRSHALVLQGGHRPPYTLYYGGAGVRAPSYEFARIPLPADVRVEGGSLGAELVNEAYEPPPDTRSLLERHDWLVEVVLALGALAVGIVGILALRRRA